MEQNVHIITDRLKDAFKQTSRDSEKSYHKQNLYCKRPVIQKRY